ncbi:MAG: PepSY-associated TM helix domain-containing protein [Mucilaginibacter sp.]|uniref:PepSY-associated TM helix domain-containing protein n=1 Tax=Mucilaginibacter sp. TaxID=1882438 RepID=UPI0031A1248F
MGSFKKAILFIHRWLGFISGLVVFVVSITGCIFCFQDEIQDALYSYRKVPVQETPMLKPSAFQQSAIKKYPKGKVTSVLYFGDGRSVQVRISNNKVLHSLFFNPYNGQFLYDQDFKNTFFNQVKNVHLYCFMPPGIGAEIRNIGVIIFVVLMITGIVLWWPKRKSDRKRSFTIKWKGKWRRVNYDLHNVLGFYATAFVLIIALSGLNMAYETMGKGVRQLLNGGKEYPLEVKKIKSDTTQMAQGLKLTQVMDLAYDTVKQKSANAQMLIMIPGAAKSGTVSVTAYPQALHFSYNDGYNFDKYNARLLRYLPTEQKSAGFRFSNMNYDIHTGQIAGLPGKIIAFLASLISASLPITGLIVYLGKRGKKKRMIRSSDGKHLRRVVS